MNKLRLGYLVVSAAALLAVPASAAMPKDRPFSMRGVELGITIEEFRQAAIPNDGDRYDSLQTWCSNDALPDGVIIVGSSRDQKDGVVECQWFSTEASLRYDSLSSHWINIGTGVGSPLFRFIAVGGELRLFEISFYANNQYHVGILDALSRGYGAPKVTVEPFQTKSGSKFTSATSVWDNGLSRITLVERCNHLERYCLTYTHSDYIKPYILLKEKQAADAASKI